MSFNSNLRVININLYDSDLEMWFINIHNGHLLKLSIYIWLTVIRSHFLDALKFIQKLIIKSYNI